MSQKKIVFHDNSLTERGTSNAVYDYAYWCREYFDLDPVICYDLKYQNNPDTVIRFSKEFNTVGYTDFLEVQKIVDTIQSDYFYAIKYGEQDNIVVNGAKNLIHSVFNVNPVHAHGDVYAVVSEWQTYKSNGHLPYVPHMLTPCDVVSDLRQELGIPKSATVVGRYGAYDTFDLDFVIRSIEKALARRPDLWFIFLNTEKKINHERCIYLDKTVDTKRKFEFINTCDAMLHGRSYGETFGLSVLEFAAMNKQIISYDNFELQTSHPLGGRNHFLFLNDQCFKFTSENDLGYLLMYLTKKNPFDTAFLKDKFSPKKVMDIFNRVFLN